MTANRKNIAFHVLGKIVIFSLLSLHAFSLNLDGTLLLALRYSVVSDPFSVFDTWHYYDQTPCSWAGVTCSTVGNNATPDAYRVISLVLPSSQLLGSIPPDLGYIEHLQQLDLSNNFFNGTLPSSLFNASELQVLSLANNFISDELPEYIGGLKSLSYLNLSHNALYGPIPNNLGTSRNLTLVSLKGNYITGNVPTGFNSTEILDLSSNLFNGSIPSSLGGLNMRYLNLSYNKLSGYVPLEFASQMLENSTIDLSFNNLTGQIPASKALLNQKSEAFAGNSDLCGKPLRKLCIIPSTLSSRPNVSASIAPAIAVIPETVDSNPSSSTNNTTILTGNHSGLKPTTIIDITLADTAGIAILGLVLVYLYQIKNKKQRALRSTQPPHPHAKGQNNGLFKDQFSLQQSIITVTDRNPTVACCCLKVSNHEAESSSESRTRSSSEAEEESKEQNGKLKEDDRKDGKAEGGGGSLVMVDGETELELETLLKASAYTLGASRSSIVYKAVLQNGTTFAVRRLGDSGVERMKDFENQVRGIAKIRHPNLVRVRGFYWGDDEKLVIYDYFPNGSLASSACREWKRNKYVGVSLVGKTLAVLGFGKVGSEVARRAKGLSMHVIAHDPYAPADRARAIGVELVSFEDAVSTADFISLHMPLTPATSKMLNDETFAKMKKGVRIVNVARGGVIDEEALVRALDSGIVAQAALDVFIEEPPPKDSKLVQHEKVTATPHLGASTMEAQEGVAVEIAEAVVGALKGELAATAVNAPMVPAEVLNELKPFVELAEKLGRLAVQLVAGGSGVKSVKVTYASARAPDDLDTRVLRAMITKGLIEPISSTFVNLVNADFTAKQRGLRITEERIVLDGSPENPLESIQVQIANVESKFASAISASGEIRLEGRVKDGIPHLTKVGSFEVDVSLEGSIILCRQVDQPGMIGRVGSILGEDNVNVSFMSVGRIAPRTHAVMAIGVDERPSNEVLKKIGDIPAIEEFVFLKL